MPIAAHQEVPPVLRWAGGKRWLARSISRLVTQTQPDTYWEPFLGGAAVFFAVPGLHRRNVLADANAQLIDFYKTLARHPDEVHAHATAWPNTPESYYTVRAAQLTDPIARAARFLYINHTSFNGIYRVNRDGVYNVPFGHRKNVAIPTVEHLRRASAKLASAELLTGDFSTLTRRARSNAFIFLDPPYTVAHNNNGFIKYNQRLFTFSDQRRLARIARALDSRDIRFVMTNAYHESVVGLYPSTDIQVVRRRNSVGGAGATRGRIEEIIITNCGSEWIDDKLV